MAGNRGRFVWYDLMTTDKDGALAFYPSVTGWKSQAWADAPEGMPPYTMWMVGEQSVGGVADLPEEARANGAPSHWIGYVAVDDVDATLAKAVGLGATERMPAMDLPSVGRIAIFADPQGANVAIFKPEGEMPVHEGKFGPGEFSWHELATTDLDAARDFYFDVFGWEATTTHDMGDSGLYAMFGAPGLELGGMFVKPPEMPGPASWVMYVTVADLDGAVEAARAGGAQVVVEPMEVPGGDRIAQLLDPQGAHFALHEKASA